MPNWWNRYYKEEYDNAEPYDVAVMICDEAFDAGEITEEQIDLGIHEISSAIKQQRSRA